MRATELLRLVWLNINQNKFKSIMTSIGIVVGAATIVLVIGIGRGGQMEVAEQFAELNAGAIDVSYEYEGDEESSGGFFAGGFGQMFGGMFAGAPGGNASGGAGGGMPGGNASGGAGEGMPGGNASGGAGEGMPSGNTSGGAAEGMPGGNASGGAAEKQDGEAAKDDASDSGKENGASGSGANDAQRESTVQEGETEAQSETSMVADRMNQERITLTESDVEDISRCVSGISGATISYHTRATVEGGSLTAEQTFTIAGVKESYEAVSKLEMAEGSFLTEEDDETKSKVCVLGATAADEIFSGEEEIAGSTLYIDDRAYTVVGVLEQSSAVSAGISPDTAVFLPYETGIKYVTGENVDPTVTVIAEDVTVLDSVIDEVRTVLEENYSNAAFTFEDSGSKMQAARASNRTLTMLLSAMAAIVFLVGGIGIMNVLFVAVKERTNEIGILKAIGTSRSNILAEFLTESAAISLIGGMLGVALGFAAVPVVGYFEVRIEVNVFACAAALGFAVLTGTVFGIYPAWKASRLEPVEALSEE